MRKLIGDHGFSGSIPRAVAVWSASNLLLCILGSYIISLICSQEIIIGYGISAVTLISSILTARIFLSSCKSGILIKALILSAIFIVFALLTGFLIDSSAIDISGILSLSTFSVSGCLIGGVTAPKKKTGTVRIKSAT